MRVIARIPDVAEPIAAGDPPPGGPPARRDRRCRPCARGLVGLADAWPVAVLAALAVVTWMMASWNEAARLQRQRSEARVAREPATVAPREPAAGADGAIVR